METQVQGEIPGGWTAPLTSTQESLLREVKVCRLPLEASCIRETRTGRLDETFPGQEKQSAVAEVMDTRVQILAPRLLPV